MDSDQKERYVRWQNYRIMQLSFSINLFLSFSIASLAYAINLKLNNILQNPELLSSSIKLWSWSSMLGCLATISRLLDFKYTAKKIRFGGNLNAFLSNSLGKVTWSAFFIQLLTYVFGAYCFITNIVNV